MIETKYGLKYHFPHSLVHIIDNSMNLNDQTVIEASDPSLFSTMVVSAMPFGEDGVFKTITRSDVLNVAWGNDTISASDIKKYGQQITYPMSLVSQNVPVRMLRVTPEGSKYAFSCIVAQWYTAPDDASQNANLKIRFLVRDGNSDEILNISNIERYKNTTRLYNKLVDIYNVSGAYDSQAPEKTPYIAYDEKFPCTHQALLICNISAGRGRNYNAIANTISQVNQAKNPPNVMYVFASYDTTTNAEVERFSAALVDINNVRADKTASVNEQIGARVDGSSLTKQYVNEACVASVFSDWRTILSSVVNNNANVNDENEKAYIKQVYNSTTVNTFDIFFGRFLATGSDDYELPRYTITMVDTDIPMLSEDKLVTNNGAPITGTGVETAANALSTKLNGSVDDDFVTTSLIGIKDGESVNVGDIYFTGNTANLVTGINQYSGGITSIAISQFRKYTAANTLVTIAGDITSQVGMINGIYSSTTLNTDNVPSAVAGKTDILYGVYNPENNAVTLYYKGAAADTLYTYTEGDIYKSLVLNNGGNNTNSYSNIIGVKSDVTGDTNTTTKTSEYGAYFKIGGTWLDLTADSGFRVVVNGNKLKVSGARIVTADDIEVQATKQVYGRIPSNVDPRTTIIGSEYDVILAGTNNVKEIYRFMITGTQGSVFSFSKENKVIPGDYYDKNSTGDYLYTPAMYLAENGGIKLGGGSTGFFDEYDDGLISTEVFKWLYSKLLVSAYRGQIDPRITSPNRVNAKYLFDAGHNTLVGITILPYMTYTLSDVAQASTMYDEDEKNAILLDPDILADPRITPSDDIDVKTAMYDLMIERVYQRIPDNRRPVGPGYGMSLHLDAGNCDAQTALLMNNAFSKKFNNPNASWDIGGYVQNNVSYTWTKRLVDNMFEHMANTSVNKPYAGEVTSFNDYQSFFPDIDTTDWEYRELMYNTGGNVWIPDPNGYLIRRSQRTLSDEATGTSDLIQESNMRTLTQFCDILQRKIDNSLLSYNDDGVIRTLEDNCNATFSPWIGNLVKSLSIKFERDVNIDGGDILVCNVRLTFRGLVLRVPILVNIDRRTD